MKATNSVADCIESPKNEEGKIYKEYFHLTQKHQEEYGKNTVVLMQVGAFFEIYGLMTSDKEYTHHSEIMKVCEMCQLNIAEKKMTYQSHQLVMAGFRDHTLEKYLQKITEQHFTAVVYVQEKEDKQTRRVFHSVHSIGTYFSFDVESSQKISNNIMCIWFDTYRPKHKNASRDNIIYGIAVANTFNGSSFLFEHETPFYMSPSTFDELDRNIMIHQPNEIIIISSFEKRELDKILQMTNIQTDMIHFFNSKTNEKTEKCSQQTYIQHILSTFYGDDVYQICSEFQNNIIATQSFCFLMNFIQEHNRDLVKNIHLPLFNNTTKNVILANHTLRQLNIIDDVGLTKDTNQKIGHLSSVLTFLNKCCSSLGKRRFEQQLLNPTFDVEWIEQQYEMTEYLLDHPFSFIESLRKELLQVKDIEKIARQIVIGKIYPSAIYHLYSSLKHILEIENLIFQIFQHHDNICLSKIKIYLEEPFQLSGFQLSAFDTIKQIIFFIESHLQIENCKGLQSIHSFDENIICPGISQSLDLFCEKQKENMNMLTNIREYFNNLMRKHNGTGKTEANQENDENEYVKLHATEKMGLSFQMTKKRAVLLKGILAKIETPFIIIPFHPTLNSHLTTNSSNEIKIFIKDIKFSSSTTSLDEIEIPIVNKLCRELLTMKEKRNKEIQIVYQQFICDLSVSKCSSSLKQPDVIPWFDMIESIAEHAGRVDLLQCRAYIAKTYHYCRPTIDKDSIEIEDNKNNTNVVNDMNQMNDIKSFVIAKQLRHVLIEHIQQNEIYVPNDITLGKENQDGMLLYGINTSGKTSLIRSLGIAIIMAQSGLFVPCKYFHYYPYKSIFSRILGNDNLFKGLSTFAVEMSELRTILKMSDKNSFVVGDELCSGTEMQSAISIFIAGLQHLSKCGASFLFATHLHEIVGFDEIREMTNIKIKHLSIHYDAILDTIIYDRILQDGSGSQNYGLIVCRSLYMPDDFMQTAYNIRNKYYPETKGELSHSTSKYNVKKIKGICEKCHENIGEETHHIREQREADKDGYIEGFHKNHPANLAVLCEKCHLKMHHTQEPKRKLIRKKTTKGYMIV